jgi:hypothetical protein
MVTKRLSSVRRLRHSWSGPFGCASHYQRAADHGRSVCSINETEKGQLPIDLLLLVPVASITSMPGRIAEMATGGLVSCRAHMNCAMRSWTDFDDRNPSKRTFVERATLLLFFSQRGLTKRAGGEYCLDRSHVRRGVLYPLRAGVPPCYV